MINVIKEQKGNELHVRLSGSIEESVNLEQLIGPPPALLHVYSKEVSRINSVGVKGWIKFFQGIQSRGTRLHFHECSMAIVEQINLISNFTCGGTVESIYVPFCCSSCKSDMIALFKTGDLKKVQFNLGPQKCPKCGGNAEFDDIPEEYFGFLSRQTGK
jgi:endogenous inhibitor of DNA gyrase (YacG/DUF329 family)